MAENQQNNSVNRAPSELTEALSGISKRCRGKCGQIKPVGRFSKHAGNKDGLQDICKECQSDFMRDYNARKSMERKAQLTAGDVQLDPKPAPMSSAGKLIKKDLVRKKAPPTAKFEKSTNLVGNKGIVKIQSPKDVENLKIKAEIKNIEKDVVSIQQLSPDIFTAEEKALIMASLDRHIALVEGIIEKLSR